MLAAAEKKARLLEDLALHIEFEGFELPEQPPAGLWNWWRWAKARRAARDGG